MDPARGSEVVIRELIVPAVRQQYEDVAPLIPGVDLVVAHPVTFAVRIAAEEAGARWVSTVLSPLSLFSSFDFPVLRGQVGLDSLQVLGRWSGVPLKAIARASTREWVAPIEDFRRGRGLPSAGHPLFEGQFSPLSTLALFSPVLSRPQSDWPPHTRATGFVFYNGPDTALAPELQEFLDRGDPPVVFTLGSSAVGAAGTFYEESARAASMAGVRAVLLVGRDAANRPARVDRNVMVVEAAPHALLFPRALATVHHGGVGTTGQALRSGRPMLVVPFAHDQPDNAHRVRKLGVARVIYPRRYRAERVARELRRLLTDPKYASHAERVGADVRAEHGDAAACDSLIAAAIS
jgi:rhamnosyltransferase subunit B